MTKQNFLFNLGVGLAVFAAAPTAHALTVTIDGLSSPTLLSDAINTCLTTDDGPDIINITTDTLSAADRQIVINKPITINGDADNNGVPCDILFDMTTVKPVSYPDEGRAGKRYIEIQTTGSVAINNLRLRPNDDGPNVSFANILHYCGAMAIFKPVEATDVSNVTLTKVYISGSNKTTGAYINLETGADLWSNANRWGTFSGTNDGNIGEVAALLISNADGAGTVHTILNQCQVGLGRAGAITILSDGASTTQIKGGLFGHCGRDGIRIGGGTVNIDGTQQNRVRIVRNTSITGNNSHSIEVVGASTVVTSLSYIDSAGCLTANGLSARDGVIQKISHMRVLGKLGDTPNNEPLYITGGKIDLIQDSTFPTAANNPNPNVMHITTGYANPVEFRDCIFTSHNLGIINLNLVGTAVFNNCAVPTDATAGESLATTPTGGTGVANATFNQSVAVSPNYMLTLADYDWSDAQGSGNPLNGAGNANVYRPSNAAYDTASSTGGKLTGGAGPDNSSIRDWMLMEM